jgi:hypothetical protein
MALAYPLTSETGNLTSIAASGDLLYLFGTALRMTTDLATIKIESNEIDVTQATGSAINMMEKFQGLRTGTVDFSGIFPRTTPPLGISALVTYASGYVAYMNALSQRVRLGDFSELSYAFNGSGNLNQTNGGLLAASGDISKPTWNIAGTSATPDQTCRLTVGGSRKWEFPAFWTKLSLSWKMDDVVRVTGTLRIASTATAS